ncbi:hypothetical protein RD792_003501 [Penstemon davidsonii]|uniref:BED-type domain-containing protein n=1 Tax=Penstemon davidsonii TaxID=160366 RepID=A0ABR0DUM9_9LAMI|nr:hypothetical protein RD792_003501 [Penstemon davidsonii]
MSTSQTDLDLTLQGETINEKTLGAAAKGSENANSDYEETGEGVAAEECDLHRERKEDRLIVHVTTEPVTRASKKTTKKINPQQTSQAVDAITTKYLDTPEEQAKLQRDYGKYFPTGFQIVIPKPTETNGDIDLLEQRFLLLLPEIRFCHLSNAISSNSAEWKERYFFVKPPPTVSSKMGALRNTTMAGNSNLSGNSVVEEFLALWPHTISFPMGCQWIGLGSGSILIRIRFSTIETGSESESEDDGVNVDNDMDNNVDGQTQHENMNNFENIDDANDDGDGVHGDGNGNDDNKANVKKPMNKRSEFWAYYTEEKVTINGVEVIKAKCIYCGVLIAAGGKRYGTNGLRNHYNACKKKPHELQTNQTRIKFQQTRSGQRGGLTNWQFNQGKSLDALCHMLIVDELPFRTVENSGFKHFLLVICPMFSIPSRRTITKNIYQKFLNERLKLMSYIKEHYQKVSITTDMWTSIQKVNYMCLTVHFIDDDWNLQKRILNFCPIFGHKGENIGMDVEKCLKDWGIEKIFTVTLDTVRRMI